MKKARIHLLLFILILISLFAFNGCGGREKESDILAKVGKTNIRVSYFDEMLSHLPERYKDVIKKRRAEFLDNMINDTLIYQKAVSEGLNKDSEVKDIIREATKKIIIARYLQDNIDDKIKITDEDIKDEYENNKELYLYPEVMRASHILFEDRDSAVSVLEDLDAGVSFEDIARAKSIDPTAQNGGDIGYFPRGQLMPEFEKACLSLNVGEISGVVKTKLGYHIVKLTDRKDPTPRPLDEIKEKIKEKLVSENKQIKFKQMIDDMRAKTNIVINEEALDIIGQQDLDEENS